MIAEIYVQSYDELIHSILNWKISAHIPLVSEWAEQKRLIPSGQSELPGKINHANAPHLVEIQDSFHPDCDMVQGTIRKGTQSLATTTLENVIGHSIEYKLHNILYIISSKNIARIRSSAAIDAMIDGSGLAQYIKPISTRIPRKLADSMFYKEMHGGRRFMLTSWNSIADAKSLSWDLIIMDELEEAPLELKGQGDPEALFSGRGKTSRTLKIAKISTPILTTGRITRNFLEGDRRYYFCQCPFCGELQVLVLRAQGRKYGLTARTEQVNNRSVIIPDTVEYICQHCSKSIREYQKGEMLQGGQWMPTARPVNPYYRSWQISNLMSPVSFYSWARCMQEFAETDYGALLLKFKNFIIDVLGEPWEARTERKKWEVVKQESISYPLREVPPGGLLLTAGVDVHKNRVEVQVVAWGIGSWIVDYRVFHGETTSINAPIWAQLEQFLKTTRYKLQNITLPISLSAVDSGYNPAAPKETQKNNINAEHTVYEFVARMGARAIACRGNSKLREAMIQQKRVFRVSRLKLRYDFAVDAFKDETALNLDSPIDEYHKINFSSSLPDEYFKGFCSEVFVEVALGDWQWKKIHDRNEPWDTYQLAAVAREFLGVSAYTPAQWRVYQDTLFDI